MPRVKCPHCGAGNQDATEQDTCWQCGNVLGAPVERSPTPARASIAEAGAPTQQLDPSQIKLPITTQYGAKAASQRTLAVKVLAALLIIGLIILLIVLLMSR